MNNYTKYSLALLFLISLSITSVSAINVEFTAPTPANNTTITGSNEFSISFTASSNPVNASIIIEDSNGNPTVYNLLNINTPYSSNFTLNLGTYRYLVGVNNTIEANYTEIRTINADTYDLVVASTINDARAIDSGSYINNATYGIKRIKAYTNLPSFFQLSILNASNTVILTSIASSVTEFTETIENLILEDGRYSYYVFANHSSGRNATSAVRTFTIDTQNDSAAENITLSQGFPFSITRDDSRTIQFNASLQGLPANLSFIARSATQSRVISSTLVDANTTLPFNVVIPVGLAVADYTFSLVVSDLAGNSNTYSLGSFSITQPAPQTNDDDDDGNSGGNSGSRNRGGSTAPAVVPNVTAPIVNITNATSNETTVESGNALSNFFNAITGAVTGANKNRSIVAVIIIAVIAIIAAIWRFSRFAVSSEKKK